MERFRCATGYALGLVNSPTISVPRRRIANRNTRRRLRTQDLVTPVTIAGVANPEGN
ncbi:MAG TPA: hypothetical protein H9881_12235 [Candidatus Stackebrandtia excrementipullorum]|nr:hypothetical protein [Candidatus Stackebrandtia excrementipullorum]